MLYLCLGGIALALVVGLMALKNGDFGWLGYILFAALAFAFLANGAEIKQAVNNFSIPDKPLSESKTKLICQLYQMANQKRKA